MVNFYYRSQTTLPLIPLVVFTVAANSTNKSSYYCVSIFKPVKANLFSLSWQLNKRIFYLVFLEKCKNLTEYYKIYRFHKSSSTRFFLLLCCFQLQVCEYIKPTPCPTQKIHKSSMDETNTHFKPNTLKFQNILYLNNTTIKLKLAK